MTDTFDPNDFKNPPINPSQFDTPPDTADAINFEQHVVDVNDLPEDKKDEYAEFTAAGNNTDEDVDIDEDTIKGVFKLMNEANKVDITDDMRESFMRSLMSNTPYQQTYPIHDNDLSITFRTLTVKEYDAIADAVGQLSQESGFVNANHLKFINFRYTVSSSITTIETKDEEGNIQIFNYGSPLTEDAATHKEKVMEIKQLDGTTKSKTVTVPITDADRIIEAHEVRFNEVNSTLYNVLLNTYSRFDNEVNALASELYQKNFTAPTEVSSL
jgi:hypothetical protein